MFHKLLIGLAATVGFLGTQVETARADVKVLPGYVKPGIIVKPIGYYPGYVYPYYPAYYPTPVIPVIPVVKYTVLYRASVYQPFMVYGSYSSHGLAHEVADSLAASGFLVTVTH